MGIFSKIKDAIWGKAGESSPATPGDIGNEPKTASASGAGPSSSTKSDRKIDVAAFLDAAVKKKGQKLKWQTSIVDLMKALDLDSSLSNRKKLATELGYDGDMKNSRKMNMWLHDKVMEKLKESGGKIPSDLH